MSHPTRNPPAEPSATNSRSYRPNHISHVPWSHIRIIKRNGASMAHSTTLSRVNINQSGRFVNLHVVTRGVLKLEKSFCHSILDRFNVLEQIEQDQTRRA